MPAPNRKRSKSNGLLTKLAWFVGIGALLVGFFSIPPNPSAQGIWETTVSRSHTIGGWFQNCAGKAFAGDFKCNATPTDSTPGITIAPNQPGDTSSESASANSTDS